MALRLQVRCLNLLPEAIGPLVLSLLRSNSADIGRGACIVADERHCRVRILPLKRVDSMDPDQRCTNATARERVSPITS